MNSRACALIWDGQNMLLLIHRRKDGREYWVFRGGSVEDGESFEQAVVREVKEEASLCASGPTLILENINAGRKERYFTFGEISGSDKLGNGPERERLSETNIYEPIWVSMAKYITLNVLPAEVKSNVVALWENRSLCQLE